MPVDMDIDPSGAAKQDENIRVVVRCRPISDEETAGGYANVVRLDNLRKTIVVQDSSNNNAVKSFTFDQVFGPDSTQPEIFNQVARPIVDNVLQGYNGTILTYGQTGSGKTFTMEGVPAVPELRGIIPNTFAHIFGHISKAEGHQKFLVRVSYFEIYMEQIRDLLVKKGDRDRPLTLEVKEDKDKGVYVKDLGEQVVHSANDLEKIMVMGKKNRITAATKMNLHSSRSHAIFTITIERSERRPDERLHICVGKLNLVDLAGSERQSKTEAVDERLKEASKINHGLSNLGNVIAALTDGKSSHVPYRNSKLTRILQDSLGGNSKTVMCANLGPASYNYDETINTLRYATRAKWIKNSAKINEDPKDALLKRLEEEIQALRKQLTETSGGNKDLSEGEEDVQDNEERLKLQQERQLRREARKEQLRQMQDEINAQREQLERNKSLGDQQRKKLRDDIAAKRQQLDVAENDRQNLLEKLKILEKTIIVGGENLLDKAEEQERLLEESAKELEFRRKKEDDLRQTLQSKKTERTQIEEKFQTLQEIAASKTFEAARLKAEFSSLKADLKDLCEENKRRLDESQINIRETEKNIKLYKAIIDRHLPKAMQEIIEANCAYNSDIGEWEVSCLAFTGAMMQQPQQGSGSGGGHAGPSLGYADALALAQQKILDQRESSKWKSLYRSYTDKI